MKLALNDKFFNFVWQIVEIVQNVNEIGRIWIQIRILLFSSLTFKTPTKND
jgi:hypothetical protein